MNLQISYYITNSKLEIELALDNNAEMKHSIGLKQLYLAKVMQFLWWLCLLVYSESGDSVNSL